MDTVLHAPPALDDGSVLSGDFVAALEAVSAPSFVHAGAEVLFANAAMQRLLGYSAEQWRVLPFETLATPDGREALRGYGLRCLREEGEQPAFEVEALTASGSIRYLELACRRVLLAGQSERTVAVMTCQDLSDMRHVQTSLLSADEELRRHRGELEQMVQHRTAELEQNIERMKETNARLEEAQNQLLQSEKMASIGQLAAGVAHEINNPIGFVSSNLGTLRRYVEGMLELIECQGAIDWAGQPSELRQRVQALADELDLEFLREDLPQLLDESDDGLVRVRKIVQDLKDFSRVDQAEWQEADLNAGLESTLNVVMNEVKYKAEVRKDFGALPPVRCLAAQLNQVFMNLIVNAAHAIAERGVITLTTRSVDEGGGSWVCVSVGDTGCGMPEAVQRRIFEPFYTTKPVGKGTGLGLSLSFSIVQRHGGRIEVRSVVGEGTTFEVWIPVNGPAPATS